MERNYKVVAAFDTETCNLPQEDGTALAYPILYILNDFSACDLRQYEPDMQGEHVTYDRYADQFIERLHQIITRGLRESYTPIICAYNLMFDLQSLMHKFAQQYDMKVSAQSSTNVYTLDLYVKGANKDDAPALLRFWDTFFLEQNGLKAMGDTAGLPKAVGDWDYSLIRTPETPLSDLELHYAKRDVQVIPAYLRYLLEANEWMDDSELGVRVLTKTSVVRRFAAETFGDLTIGHDRKGRDVSMLHGFQQLCMRDMPKDYETYALRKACFRGGGRSRLAITQCRQCSMSHHSMSPQCITHSSTAFIYRRIGTKPHVGNSPYTLNTCLIPHLIRCSNITYNPLTVRFTRVSDSRTFGLVKTPCSKNTAFGSRHVANSHMTVKMANGCGAKATRLLIPRFVNVVSMTAHATRDSRSVNSFHAMKHKCS